MGQGSGAQPPHDSWGACTSPRTHQTALLAVSELSEAYTFPFISSMSLSMSSTRGGAASSRKMLCVASARPSPRIVAPDLQGAQRLCSSLIADDNEPAVLHLIKCLVMS
jgi:hypothetical protein